MDCCGNCANSRENSRDGVYCLMFGIMVSKKHEGCASHLERGRDEIREPQNHDRRDHL